ncbi:unnamed protein product [Cyprideis torosa]|uniref:Uncharacterized protein n=1 Tax=Cyprideis torosa TaxID=163714 RepID=A0A7R8ZTB6_9CRUS|nr:unnamed protein product [Cyprideis torosa]CAG0897831.1 unnamed protein product [Cyprideis torosa]
MKGTLAFGLLFVVTVVWARPTEEEDAIIVFADNRVVDERKLIENVNLEHAKGVEASTTSGRREQKEKTVVEEETRGASQQTADTIVFREENPRKTSRTEKNIGNVKGNAPEVAGEFVDEIVFRDAIKGKSLGKNVDMETIEDVRKKNSAPKVIGEFVDEIVFRNTIKKSPAGKTADVEKKVGDQVDDLTDEGIALNELEPSEFSGLNEDHQKRLSSSMMGI